MAPIVGNIPEQAAHALSLAADKLVRQTANRESVGFLPGKWDFEKVFLPIIALMDLRSRLSENELAATSAVAAEAHQLYLLKRLGELRESIRVIEALLAGPEK